MNQAFAVYTACNFSFESQNMYYHSEVTLSSAKREHGPTSSTASNTFDSSAIWRLAATVQQS